MTDYFDLIGSLVFALSILACIGAVALTVRDIAARASAGPRIEAPGGLADERPVFESETNLWEALDRVETEKEWRRLCRLMGDEETPAPEGYVHAYAVINGEHVYQGLMREKEVCLPAPQPARVSLN